MDTALRALNRFGLGARVGERQAIDWPREWLRAQLEDAPLARMDGPELGEINRALIGLREAQRARDRDGVAAARRALREIQARELSFALTKRITSDSPYVERLVSFWSNHLCVSVAGNPRVAALAGHYERTVVRAHVLGRFEEMVLASAKHPAMLLYLDNFQSVGPGSQVGQRTARRGRPRGLNENYARELLELHTVGVDGGFTQADVEQLARILTGWGVGGLGPGARAREPLGFVFRPQTHEPGAKTVLGVRYGPFGVGEGEEAIRDLCRHADTAARVARKLVRHFVSDDPPPAAVDKIARTFSNSDGDLKEVARALIDVDEAWQPDERKFRTPQDWLVAVLRCIGAEAAPERSQRFLTQLRHAPWGPAAPKGYGDTEREWADPDSLLNRAELARTVARRIGGRRLDPREILDVVDVESTDPLATLLADSSIAARERVALAFAGPAFQWR